MMITHLMASPFLGGPERQMLGLASHLPKRCSSAFLSFSERGRCRPLLEEARQCGYEAVELHYNTRHPFRACREIAGHLRRLNTDVLCCSGYKPDVIGWRAARQAGVPVVSISHGWTAATWKVRLYEALDRLVLRWMDATVCVSEAQAARVLRAGVPRNKVIVIRNAVEAGPYQIIDPQGAEVLRSCFLRPPQRIVGAAGRLSPEKGFDQLVEAAALIARGEPETGFVVFGDGPLREELERRIAKLGLADRIVLAGFRTDLAAVLPHLDLLVLPSYTEGLPVVILEAFAAGIPVVATAVGGTPEVVEDGFSGYLVPPGDPPALAQRIRDVLRDDARRQEMGRRGRQRVREEFTFEAQSSAYFQLFRRLTGSRLQTGPAALSA